MKQVLSIEISRFIVERMVNAEDSYLKIYGLEIRGCSVNCFNAQPSLYKKKNSYSCKKKVIDALVLPYSAAEQEPGDLNKA